MNKNRSGSPLNGGRHQWITVALLALIIVLVLVASYGIMEVTERRAHASAEKLVSQVVQHIDEKMDDVKTVTREAAGIARGELDNPDALEQLTRDFVSENKFVYGSTVAFEPNVFPGRGRCFAPYSWVTPDGKVHSRQLGTETDYYEEEWYSETKLSGEEYWCEPYFDEGGAKVMMCTFSVPLKDSEGNLVAVMTADVGLDDLEAYITTISPSPDSYIVLRSAKGTPLVNGDMDSDEENNTVIIKGMTDIGWSVELMIPFNYLMRGDSGIFLFIGSVFLFTILFVYFINRLLSGMQQRSSAEYLRVIDAISSSFSSIYLVNLKTTETFVFRDPGIYEKYIGRFKDEKLDFTARFTKLINYDCYPPDRDRMLREITMDVIRGKLTSQDRYEVRFRKEQEDGICWYEMHVFVVERDGLGAPLRAVVAFADVNKSVQKEKERQDTLEEALKAAQSANKAKSTFLFNMSHDIRTPMNAILGYTDMAIRHIDETDTSVDCLQKIKASGGHLLNLINDILEMSRIESGKLELTREPLDIRETVRNIEHMSQALAVPKSIHFEVFTGEIRNPYVYADELHFNEVMINIISNAMKYSYEDGTVRFEISQCGDVVFGEARYRFVISDNGIGMEEDFLEHIYESFVREKSTTVSKLEGAGLGLSIVKRIVDLAEGTIDIKSKPGKGTRVTVELPLLVMDDVAVEKYTKEHEAAAEVSDSAVMEGKRVLLVEDNEMNREIAGEILEEAGFDVETAEDGDIAVKTVAQKGADYYDIILMDIQMPVMNGYEATKAIRRLPDGDKVPIIAVSANAFEEDKQKSLEAGMNAHVAKPIDVNNLLLTMHTMTRR